jgi:hypothetical protein
MFKSPPVGRYVHAGQVHRPGQTPGFVGVGASILTMFVWAEPTFSTPAAAMLLLDTPGSICYKPKRKHKPGASRTPPVLEAQMTLSDEV